MAHIEKNFLNSRQIYQAKQTFLPSKILWKLDLILSFINQNQPRKQILSLQQQMEYEDLENLQNQSLKLVFISIIETIFCQSTIQRKECYTKKKGFFSNWTKSLISSSHDDFLITYQNKTYSFNIELCEIKKSKEKKPIIELFFKKTHKYSIKFQTDQQVKGILAEWQRKKFEYKENRSNKHTKISFVQDSQLQFSHAEPSQYKMKRSWIEDQNQSVAKNHSFTSSEFKRNNKQRMLNARPTPQGYQKKVSKQKLLIAQSNSSEAKIYVQFSFERQVNFKRLVSALLLQKSWNKFLIYQNIEKSFESPNQIQISRKYDTFKQLNEFVGVNLKVTYTSWNQNMCMITATSIKQADQQLLIDQKCFITIQYVENQVKIVIEDQLNSLQFKKQSLNNILFENYRQIQKLQFIYDKIQTKNFQAQTIVNNLFQDEESTNTQSQEDFLTVNVIQSRMEQKQSDQINQNEEQDVQILKDNNQLDTDNQILRLKSPLQYPNLQFINQIRNKSHQRTYFKHIFSQERSNQYDNYIPFYRLDKMLESKTYQVLPSRQLKFIDQELIDSQKQTLRFVIRQIGANLISGKSVLNVSLPVEIFQPRTGLERSASSFGSCPDFFIPRANSSPIQQIKYVIGFIIFAIKSELVMQKPFNPIVGQTFQGFIKGIPIYYEQISHSPPITSYFMKCPQFTIYGNLIPFADVGLNTAVGGNLGLTNIIFANGSHFQCYFPPSQIAGLIYGDRKFRCYNKGYIFERNECLFSQLSLQNQKKGVYQVPRKLKVGELVGGIYKVKPSFFIQIDRFKTQNKSLKKFGGLTKQYIVEKYHTISGQWFKDLFIDNEIINDNINLYPIQYAKNVLPSDSNFRLDVLYLKIKDLTNSQKQKEILQNIQRNDKKLRQKTGK